MPPKPPHDAAAPLSARIRCGVHSCPSRRGLGSDGLGRCRPSRGWGGEVPYAACRLCVRPQRCPRMCVLHAWDGRSVLSAWRCRTPRAQPVGCWCWHRGHWPRCSSLCTRHALAASGTGGGSAPRPLKGDWRAPAPCPAWHHSSGRPCLVQLHILGRVPGPDGMLDDRSALTRVHVHKSELHRLRQHESPFCPALGRLVANPHPSKAAITPSVRCILCRLIADETAGHPRTD
jgi:hypothetical protein